MFLVKVLLVVALGNMVQAQSRGELRLVRSSTTSFSTNYSYTSGRLEIYMGSWVTICNDADFDWTEATVACQQLGWSGALSYGYSSSLGFGQGLGQARGTIFSQSVNCSSSSYLHLLSCQLRTIISRNCDHSDDVAVHCNSTRLSDNPYELQIRLTGGSYPSRGRVEVYCNGEWGTICGTTGFDSTEAGTVCRQLGYTGARTYGHLNLPDNSTQPIWLKYFRCGTLTNSCLYNCTFCPVQSITSCTHSSDVTVQCEYLYSSRQPSRRNSCRSNGGESESTVSRGELRLVRGNTASYSYMSGRLEIYLNGSWGTICNDNDTDFGWREATVACQQLGWSGASDYGSSISMGFGEGNGTILLDDVNCHSSSLLHLLSCQYSTAISSFCDHNSDIAVDCNSTRLSDNPYELQVRLTGGSYPSRGRVEVYCNGEWGTICGKGRFGSIEAETVCRQLGYTGASGYNRLYIPGNSTQPIWLRYFSCGTYSDRCLDTCTSCPLQSITSCTHGSDVTVQCDYHQSGYPSRRTSCPRSRGGGGNGGGGMPGNALAATIGSIFSSIFSCCCIIWSYPCFIFWCNVCFPRNEIKCCKNQMATYVPRRARKDDDY